jgi:hypothetical protein
MARGRRGEGEPRAAHCQPRRKCAAILIASAGAALWLGATAATGQQDATAPPRRASVALEVAHRYAKAVPARTDTVVLAAQGTQEGHWRFVNRAGEMFTVGTADEMTRVVAVLYPQAKPGARLALYMTEDTVFRHGVAFKSLPAAAELNMVMGGESYRLLRRGDAAGTQLYAEVRTNLAVELKGLQLLEEALWHLARPLRKAGVRLLALEPGGPATLPASPRIDPGTKRTLVDAVDPAALAAAMAGVSGQTLVVLGRVERDLLHIRPAAGPERSLALDQLYKAADVADAGLIVLQAASTPRQPTGRNALRQDGGGQAPAGQDGATLADLLNAVAGPSRRLAVAATRAGRRTVIEASLVGDLTGGSGPRPADARLAGFAGDVAAVGIYAVRANLLTAARQSDLDQRIIPGVPFAVQAGYAALLVLGLLGTPVARAWWARIWPAEAASEYAGRSGYWVACAIRVLAFALVFLPLTALIAAPYSLGGQIRDAVRGPALWWRRIAERGKVGGEAPRPATSRQASGRTTADAVPPPVPIPPPVRMPPPAPAETARRAAKEQPARSWIAAFTREEEPK